MTEYAILFCMTPALGLTNLYPRTPLVLGHRGAAADAPENTLAAFELALEQGADGIELDVTLTADGAPVVIHDDTLERTTNGHGPVGALTLAELKTLEAGYPAKFGQRFRGLRVPTLSEVFQAAGEPAIVQVEIKHDRSRGRQLAQRVVEVIRERGREGRVLISSFQFSSLGRVKALDPDLPVALLYQRPSCGPRLAKLLAGRLPHEAHNPSAERLTAADIAWYHERGLRVNAWTVDDEAEMRRLFAGGVDGLITNRPDLAMRVRAIIG
jgi:glycerophosphoryl diester phosphodiesterase